MHSVLKKLTKIIIVITPVLILVFCLVYKINNLESNSKNQNRNTLIITEIVAKNLSGIQDSNGKYVDWIELYNPTNYTINLKGYGLSDDINNTRKFVFPDVLIYANSYKVIYMDIQDTKDNNKDIYTNFRLSANGDIIILSDPNGIIIDKLSYNKQYYDIPYGRTFPDYIRCGYLSYSTPGKANSSSFMFSDVQTADLGIVKFSKEGGFYDTGFYLTLSCDDPNALILYTTDGSEPLPGSYVYTEPIEIKDRSNEENKYVKVPATPWQGVKSEYGINKINKCTVIRARIYKDGYISEDVTTKSYFINCTYTLPVISLSTDPDNLFSNENGIYVPGYLYYLSRRIGVTDIGNYSTDTKVDAAIEIWDTNKNPLINCNIKLSLFGGVSRRTSLLKNFNCRLSDKSDFSSIGLPGYSVFNLRGPGGWTTYNSLYEDCFLENLFKDLNIGAQTSQFTILYINGEYWGIYTINENKGAQYFLNNYGIKETDLILIKNGELLYGTIDDYNNFNMFYKMIQETDFSEDHNYNWLSSQIDIDEFIRYMIAGIYCDNQDWLNINNFAIWKSKTINESNPYSDGKWRFYVFDLDRTLEDPSSDTFERLLSYKTNGENKLSEFLPALFHALWKNPNFQKSFAETLNFYLQNQLSAENSKNEFIKHISYLEPEIIELINRLETRSTIIGNLISLVMPENISDKITIESWNEEKEKVLKFIELRPFYLQKFIKKYCNLIE